MLASCGGGLGEGDREHDDVRTLDGLRMAADLSIRDPKIRACRVRIARTEDDGVSRLQPALPELPGHAAGSDDSNGGHAVVRSLRVSL